MKTQMPKNILIIGNTNKLGGVETFIYNTTMCADREKFQFYYLVHGSDHCVFEKEINAFYSNEQHIFFLPSYKKHPLKCICALRTFYKEHQGKLDIIHLETGSDAEIVYVVPFARKIHAKVIVHSHNGDGCSHRLNAFFRLIVNHATDKRLACSDVAAAWLFGKKHVKDTEIIKNGIDTNKFSFSYKVRNEIRRELDVEESTFVIGHIGRFSSQKNHAFLLQVFFEILKKRPDSLLVLIGVGELQNDIKHLAKELKIDGKIIFLGRKHNPEKYYFAFDLFLMPSLYEGLPIVGVEAQASGLPCLFSDTISNQVNLTEHVAFFSLDKPAEAWADKALCSACPLEERKKYAEMVKSMGFDLCDTAKKLETVYMQL